MFRSLGFSLSVLIIVSTPVFAHEEPDYPTAVLADYVFACMAANGQRFDILQKCSCSIDYIAKRLPFKEYEEAETVMQLQQENGQRGVFYRDTKWANQKMDRLKKTQAESTLACFKS